MKNKIAVIHPELKMGGSELVAVWIIEALKKENDVSLITGNDVNLSEINKYYGTDIKEGEIKIITVKPLKLFKNKFDALRGYRLARFCKKMAPEFDIMISAYNVMDFGRKGIQFIADFSFDDELRNTLYPEPEKSQKWFYKKSVARKIYLKIAEFLSGSSKKGWEKNITFVNSKWTEKILKEKYGITASVIYPPVIGKFFDIPWDKRENGFLFLGRISPEKEIEKIIKILAEVKKNISGVHLHIVGGTDDRDYAKNIEKICRDNGSWCFLEGPLYGQDKLNFIAKHKFGISGLRSEAFGISVAEMVKSGNIVFVPDGGGQTEIVRDSGLIYRSVEDAVQKIEKVIKNENLQNDMRAVLSLNVQKFSLENFTKEVKMMISDFLI